jgi:hypothetical protein
VEKVSKATASDVQASFRELAKTASQLNTVSDALGKYVAEVEIGLKTLNLGVAAWVNFGEWTSSDGMITTCHQIGFAKIGKSWSIGVRHFDDAVWADEWVNFELWVFNEAPRQSRIDAIDHLPALIQALNKEAAKIAKVVADKLPSACKVASDIATATGANTYGNVAK